MSVLQMSFSGAVMILAAAVIRALALNRLPKRTFTALWELALLRLLVPFSIPSVTSVYTLFVKNEPQADVFEAPAIYGILPAYAGDRLPSAPDEAPGGVPVLTIVRLAGTFLCALGFIISYLLAFRRFGRAQAVRGGYAAGRLEAQRLRRRVEIRLCGEISSPLTYGIFRPVILLPSGTDMNGGDQLDYILTHELTHIKRFDTLRKLAAAAAVCVHWFNPAVWAMYLLYNRDIELACDEAVVRKTKGDVRGRYASALIDMEEKRAKSSSLHTYFSKSAIEERVTAIMKTGKIKFITILSACVLVAAAAAVFATSAYTDRTETADVTAPEYKTYTGYFVKTTREPFLLIESGAGILDGADMVKLAPEASDISSGVFFDGLMTGDNVKITTNRRGDSKPYTVFVHSAEKLSSGETDYIRIDPVIKLGYIVEVPEILDGGESVAYVSWQEPGQEPIYTTMPEPVLPDIAPSSSPAEPDVFREPSFTVTREIKHYVSETFDISRMHAMNGLKPTPEYSKFIDYLISVNAFTREQADTIFKLYIPMHTAILSGPLDEDEESPPDNIIGEIDTLIKEQTRIIRFVAEKSADPSRAQPEDDEFLEKTANISIKLMFRDILAELTE